MPVAVPARSVHPARNELRWGETREMRGTWARMILGTEAGPLSPYASEADIPHAIFENLASEDFLPVLPQDQAALTLLGRHEELLRDVRVGVGDAFQSAREYQLKQAIQSFVDAYWTTPPAERRAACGRLAVDAQEFSRLRPWLDRLTEWLDVPLFTDVDPRTDLVRADLLKIATAHPAQQGRCELDASMRWSALSPSILGLPPALARFDEDHPDLAAPWRSFRALFDSSGAVRPLRLAETVPGVDGAAIPSYGGAAPVPATKPSSGRETWIAIAVGLIIALNALRGFWGNSRSTPKPVPHAQRAPVVSVAPALDTAEELRLLAELTPAQRRALERYVRNQSIGDDAAAESMSVLADGSVVFRAAQDDREDVVFPRELIQTYVRRIERGLPMTTPESEDALKKDSGSDMHARGARIQRELGPVLPGLEKLSSEQLIVLDDLLHDRAVDPSQRHLYEESEKGMLTFRLDDGKPYHVGSAIRRILSSHLKKAHD